VLEHSLPCIWMEKRSRIRSPSPPPRFKSYLRLSLCGGHFFKTVSKLFIGNGCVAPICPRQCRNLAGSFCSRVEFRPSEFLAAGGRVTRAEFLLFRRSPSPVAMPACFASFPSGEALTSEFGCLEPLLWSEFLKHTPREAIFRLQRFQFSRSISRSGNVDLSLGRLSDEHLLGPSSGYSTGRRA